MMRHTFVYMVLVVLEAIVGLTAVMGGVALVTGAVTFPVEWLQGTPFSDYMIPGLMLAIVVGGSSLFAAATILARREVGVFASALAGVSIAGYEVVYRAQVEHLDGFYAVYFVLGVAIFGLATDLWMAEYRRQHALDGSGNHI